MLVIRPITEADYPALMRCAEESGHGFTSLPVNEKLIRGKIHHSVESFAKEVSSPGTEGYLMVAEDLETGEVVGTTGIEATVGLDVPFYSYHISKVVHASRKLGVHNIVELLTFGNNYTGCSEVCTLFLRPEWREGANGRLLSKCRFLMMGEYPQRFSKTVFAEMRGVSDEEGHSPFWEWLKDHFFSIEFTHADYLVGVGHKGFIADLMPKLPIYVSLLSSEAQEVIGQVHEKTRPALRLLEKEGFTNRGYVAIFDAGPTVECDVVNIKSVYQAFHCSVEVSEHTSSHEYLISNTEFRNFRAVAGTVDVNTDRTLARISPEMADALRVVDGDTIRLIAQ
ncbi:arginine N-succinyltransferase [Photobacterium chitinilyticum]|uniref:Arginine N-succinyltransferase n=1 Tax=Photobacterium chitinilyticum TaxID=2485123 RepID=A0A444JVM2_9GAMM|nr:arginine N-succinyltransferase [Photobacterium chitinilyticum]RWX57106.1 arginine N-succinyltransferase [Photobacterium chitinilyticum]